MILELGQEVAVEEVVMVDLDWGALGVTEVFVKLGPHLPLRLVQVGTVAGECVIVSRAASTSILRRHSFTSMACATVSRLRAERVRGCSGGRVLIRELALTVLVARGITVVNLVLLVLIAIHNFRGAGSPSVRLTTHYARLLLPKDDHLWISRVLKQTLEVHRIIH